MKEYFILLCFFVMSLTLLGQEKGDTLYLYDSSFLTRYIMNDEKLKTSDLDDVTETVPAAHAKMKRAIAFKRTSNVLKYLSAAALVAPVAWSVGFDTSLRDELGFRPIYAAAGLFVISLPFNMTFKKNAAEGAAIYNTAIRNLSSYRSSLSFQFSPNGMSLSFVF